jgi:hypothetical protein
MDVIECSKVRKHGSECWQADQKRELCKGSMGYMMNLLIWICNNCNQLGIRSSCRRVLLKGTSNNSILFPDLGFFPDTALPKYSFSDAKLCFCRLVSEKNTCVDIPKGINRGPLNCIPQYTPRSVSKAP